MLYQFSLLVLAVLVFTSSWFLYGQRVGKLDVADEAWGVAQPYIVIVSILVTGQLSLISIVLLLLTSLWGFRLFYHLRKRHSQTAREDKRYTEMKANWKKYPKIQAYVYVFLLQGLLMFILGLISMVTILANPAWQPISLVGVVVWIFGFTFEAVADRQLAAFVARTENRGKIMDQGLWKYSRHPNYFGELVMWWGIFIFTYLNTGAFWTIVSPLTISYLIIFVSGIPLTEKQFISNPLWSKYKNRTSALIPLPPKNI